MSKKVFIGAGHGGSDPGATANGFYEKDLNLPIALACRDELKKYGVEVLMSRTADVDDTLNAECKRCNSFAPDLALDIHNNAGGGDGAEVYYHVGGGVSKTLAQNILNEIVKIGQNSRGIKTKVNDDGTDWLGFIRMTSCPAVLVECAFMDNKADLQTVNTPEKQKTMGTAIAKGILKTLCINTAAASSKPTDTKDTNKNTPRKKLYRVQVGAFAEKSNAENMLKELKKKGFDGFITT